MFPEITVSERNRNNEMGTEYHRVHHHQCHHSRCGKAHTYMHTWSASAACSIEAACVLASDCMSAVVALFL